MNMLYVGNMPQLPFDVSEALNQLRVNLGFSGEHIKTVMVTSTAPNEGKSFICMNLWKMLADLGMKTLFIDCDLRNSEIRTKYRIRGENLAGIAHYLSGKLDLQDVIYQTNIPNGFMIPLVTTVANPTILLEGQRFSAMIQSCAEVFDYVLIDTPPLGNVADALNIATHCDGSLLVVGSGIVPRKMVEDSVQMLRRTNTALLGTVLNRVQVDRKSNAYYRRHYRYGKYYKGYSYGYGDKIVTNNNRRGQHE